MNRTHILATSLAAACMVAMLAGCGGESRSTGPPATSGLRQCPLTGRASPSGGVPARPALAVKVDNVGPARPQYGLRAADVIFEEPVEGGLTRLIAIYQCQDAARIEPIRSARIIDPEIVQQFGAHPLFAYAGGIAPAVAAVRSSPLVDVGTDRAPAGTYRRDPRRVAPHNLYSSTAALYAAGRARRAPATAPAPVFTFGPLPAGSTRASRVHIAFPASPVTWDWDPAAKAWRRSDPTGWAGAAEGGVLSAANVIIMSVALHASRYVEDPTGAHENLLTLTGTGRAEVLRDGAVIPGTWRRAALRDTTRFVDRAGRPIPLATGQTWVELVPTDVATTRS